VQGRGLFSGEPCRLRFLPAPAGSGIVFVRSDLPNPVRIAADVSNLAKRARRSSLMNGTVAVETVEHVMAAVWGLGIDNIEIEMNAAETPSTDGSSMPFIEALQEAGVEELSQESLRWVITEPITVSEGDAMLAAVPGPEDCLEILYHLDYSSVPSIGRQVMVFRLGKDDFVAQLGRSRTFSLKEEAQEMQARGIGKHLSARDVLVMGADGPIDNELRYPDEHVRHKIVDLIGDLASLGARLCGRVVAYGSGHELNRQLLRRLREEHEARRQSEALKGEPLMDVRKIMRLLKHRYPFLMIDRILKIEGDRYALGVKNVTVNEPYFQGHYPNVPIMPGVMILEALAQLSGILLSRRLEHTGKVALLLSMDRVKMRRLVRPGDQLILEAEAIHVRTRTGHCRCRAKVGQEVAAEAEIKFILVDDDPV